MNEMNWHSCFFLLFALLACGSAVAVVVVSDIVRTACFLVASLAAVAGLFFLAGAEFLGAVQLMVYVGGTMVLLIFGVMLTARGPSVGLRTGGGQWVVALLAGGALLVVLLQAAWNVSTWRADAASGQPAVARTASISTALGLGLVGVRADRLDQPDPVLREGMSGYLLAFEIISVHFVVVLVGAAYLARARKKADFRCETASGFRVR